MPRRRDPMAQDVRTPKYRPRVVRDKTKDHGEKHKGKIVRDVLRDTKGERDNTCP